MVRILAVVSLFCASFSFACEGHSQADRQAAGVAAPSAVAGAQTADFEVKGMTCSSCAKHVKETLGTVKGVNSVTVETKKNHVAVAYLPELVKPEAIAQAITDAGYPAKLKGVHAK